MIYGMKPELNNKFGSNDEVENMESEGRLSTNDPHSYANTEDVTTTHIHIELDTIFFNVSGSSLVKLRGFVILHLLKKNKSAKTVRIDARELQIESITVDDSEKGNQSYSNVHSILRQVST